MFYIIECSFSGPHIKSHIREMHDSVIYFKSPIHLENVERFLFVLFSTEIAELFFMSLKDMRETIENEEFLRDYIYRDLIIDILKQILGKRQEGEVNNSKLTKVKGDKNATKIKL